jgi:hypothetical protein
MPDGTEGMSPLEHFNLVMDEIRAGRGLSRKTRTQEEYWRENLAPAHVDGVKVLVVVVSRFPPINEDIENYELLLKATYGRGGLIGEPDPNVKMQGGGYPTAVPFAGTIYRGESHIEHNRISQEEMADIIFGEAFHAGDYDQIHIVGHGDQLGGKRGMLFYPVYNKEKGWRRSKGFDKSEAGKLSYKHCWPLKTGGKVLLIGCKVDLGGFKEFVEGVVGSGNVYAVTEDIWKCTYGWVDDEEVKFGALDWFHPEQDASTKHIAEWLGLKAARSY